MNDTPARRRIRDLPVFVKLMLPFLVLILVVAVAGLLVVVRELAVKAENALDQELAERSFTLSATVKEREIYLLEAAGFGSGIQGMARAVRDGSPGRVGRLLDSVRALKPDLDLLAVVDRDGRELARLERRGDALVQARRPDRPVPPAVWEALADREGRHRVPVVLTVGDTPIASTVVPICAGVRACDPVGAVIVGVAVERIASDAAVAIDARSDADDEGGIAIYDQAGALIVAAGASPVERARPGDEPRRALGERDGTEHATRYAPFELLGQRQGSTAVTVPTDPSFAFARRAGVRLALIVLVAMFAVVAIGVLLARSLTEPVRSLLETSRTLGSGDLSARAPVVARDEIGELAVVLNQMADQLQASHETLEARVDQRTAEVRRLLKERTEFFAGISHELRTPLAVILGQAKMLQDAAVQREKGAVAETGQTIVRSSEQLLRLINEILDLARAERGQVDLEVDDLAVKDVVAPLRRTAKGLADASRVRLSVTVPARLPKVRADAFRTREILLNLIDNGIKYTPPGGRVTVSAEAVNGSVRFSVADEGVGIPPDIGERVFEPFYRVPNVKAFSGKASSGLGLALSRKLAEAQGGTVDYRSGAAGGTTFTLELPAAAPDQRAGTRARRAPVGDRQPRVPNRAS